jgi:hypothetical protein
MRKFADFRQPVIQARATDEEPIERVVMRLFANSADGLRVLGWMLSETSAPCLPNAEDRALREAEGARRFVSRIHEITQGQHGNS